VLTILARLRSRKGSNDARPGRRDINFGYCVRAQKGAAKCYYGADDAGRGIVALVQKAADLAKADCNRAMNLAHRLSSELRAAEERAREFEAQANYFRDRAAHAEKWLVRIRREVEETFFETKEQQQRPVREVK
jgi:hypothetical protein